MRDKKRQITSTKTQTNSNYESAKNLKTGAQMDDRARVQYDLEDRTHEFAQRVHRFFERLPRTIANFEDGKQVIRSSGSVGGNYIEANEALSKKDFRHRIRICRKESKESSHWLRLLDTGNQDDLEQDRALLVDECRQLVKIFSAILRNSSGELD